MSTKYPEQIDTNVEIPLSTDNVTPVASIVTNTLRSAILAMETELGISPAREYGSVRARLDALQAAITGTSSLVGGLNPNRILVSDQSGAISSAIALTGIQFSVFMENPVGTMAWQKITSDMIAPSFAISLSGGSVVEVGQTVTTPAFTASYNNTPVSVILSDSNGSPNKDVSGTPNSFSSNATVTKNTVGATSTFTITASDGTTTKTANTNFIWEQKNYYGVGTAGQTSAAFILSLTGFLSNTQANTFSTTASSTQKIYFASRAVYGTPTFTVGGFSGGFNLVSNTISVTNTHSFTENYQLWESTNLNLGTTTVVVS